MSQYETVIHHLGPLHHGLRERFAWYDRWHAHPHAISIHLGAMAIVLVAVVSGLAGVLLPLGSQPQAATGIVKQLPFQGYLTDSAGQPVADGKYSITFRLYDVATGGTAAWTETRTGTNQVQVTDGLFSVLLGSLESLGSIDFNTDTWFLGIQVGSGSELAPRLRLGAAPFALNSDKVDGKDEASFALLEGRSGGQQLRGGTGAADQLILESTGSTTKGKILFGTSSAYDQANTRLGLGNTSPNATLDISPSNADALRVNPFGTGGGQTGQLELTELSTNGANYVGFKAPDNIGENSIWTLPSGDGSSGQVLQTNGSGSLTFSGAQTLASSVALQADTSIVQDGSESLTLSNTGTGNTIANLTSTGDFVIQDAGTTFVTFSDTGTMTVNSGGLVLADGNALTLTGGQLLINDGNTFAVKDASSNTLLSLVDSGSTTTATINGPVTTGTHTIGGADTDLTTGPNENLTITPNGSGDTIFSLDGDTNFQVIAGAPPTSDLVAITNNGQGVTTANGVNGLTVSYSQSSNAANIQGNAIIVTLGPSGDAGDIIRGLQIAGITPSASLEQAINIGAGFDQDLVFLGTSDHILQIDNTSTLIVKDASGNGLFQVTDVGSIGNVTVTGDLTVSGGDVTGTNSASIDLGEATSGAITFTAGSGGDFVFQADSDSNIQEAMTVTGTSGNDLFVGTITNQTSSGTQRGIVLTNADDAANATTEALISLDNQETTANTVTDYLLITKDPTGQDTTADAIDVSDADLFNAINVGTNNVLFSGVRIFEAASTILTVEDTSGNDLLTVVDGGTVGNVTVTGTLTTNGEAVFGSSANVSFGNQQVVFSGATGTLTPSSSYINLRCNRVGPADTALTLDEVGAADGQLLLIAVDDQQNAGTCSFADIGGVQNVSATITLDDFDSIMFIYKGTTTTQWVMLGTSNN